MRKFLVIKLANALPLAVVAEPLASAAGAVAGRSRGVGGQHDSTCQ